MTYQHSRSFTEADLQPVFPRNTKTKNPPSPQVYRVQVKTCSLKEINHIQQRFKSLYMQKYKDKLNIHPIIKTTAPTQDNLAKLTTKELDDYIKIQKNKQTFIGAQRKTFTRQFWKRQTGGYDLLSQSTQLEAYDTDQQRPELSGSLEIDNSKFEHTRIFQSSFLAKLNKIAGEQNSTTLQKTEPKKTETFFNIQRNYFNTSISENSNSEQLKNISASRLAGGVGGDSFINRNKKKQQQQQLSKFRKKIKNSISETEAKNNHHYNNSIIYTHNKQHSATHKSGHFKHFYKHLPASSAENPVQEDDVKYQMEGGNIVQFTIETSLRKDSPYEKSIPSIPCDVDEFEPYQEGRRTRLPKKAQEGQWFEGMSKMLLKQSPPVQQSQIRGMDMEKTVNRLLYRKFGLPNRSVQNPFQRQVYSKQLQTQPI